MNQIPSVAARMGDAISVGFTTPLSYIGRSVWPSFMNMIAAAGASFGLTINGATAAPIGALPIFHEGGVVGQDGGSFSGNRSLDSDEMFALLQKGEGVMSQEMMASMTAAQISEFRKGNPRWYAAGGPSENGRAYVDAHLSDIGSKIKTYDLAAMKATYADTIVPMMAQMQAGNVSAEIGRAAVDTVARGAFDWVKGANEGVAAEQAKKLGAIGLPPGFDIHGAVPEGFDVDSWRGFLGSNKHAMDFPLLESYLQAAGVPFLVNSTFRPGGTSYHASGRAVDFGAPNDSNYDSPGLQRINHAFAPMLGVLSELIYAGPGGITDKAYDAATMAGHHNHVHAALAQGGIVQSLLHAVLGEDGTEVVIPLTDPGRALDIAMSSGLFNVLADAAQARQGGYARPAAAEPTYGPSPLAAVSANRPGPATDGGFLGGGPGNTYHIQGVDLDHVKAEIRNRDAAVMRVRK